MKREHLIIILIILIITLCFICIYLLSLNLYLDTNFYEYVIGILIVLSLWLVYLLVKDLFKS